MTEPTYTENVTQLRGDMREGFAEIKGTINELAAEVRSSNQARTVEAIELRRDVDRNTADIHAIQLRFAAMDAAPGLTWKTVIGDVKVWITVAAIAFGIWQGLGN